MLKIHAIMGLFILVATGPTLALTANDTMADWSHASEGDRSTMLDGLGPTLSQAYKAEKADLLVCLNRVGRDAPHAALLIRDIARACVAIVEHRDPDNETHPNEI